MVAKASSESPALGVSYSVQLDDKRNIVAQTYVPVDCTPVELDAILNKVGDAVDRQAAKYSIKALERSLRMQQKQLKRVTEDLAFQDDKNQNAFRAAGKKGQFRLTNEQETHRANVFITQTRFQEEIDDLKREIAEAKAIFDGSNGGANR